MLETCVLLPAGFSWIHNNPPQENWAGTTTTFGAVFPRCPLSCPCTRALRSRRVRGTTDFADRSGCCEVSVQGWSGCSFVSCNLAKITIPCRYGPRLSMQSNPITDDGRWSVFSSSAIGVAGTSHRWQNATIARLEQMLQRPLRYTCLFDARKEHLRQTSPGSPCHAEATPPSSPCLHLLRPNEDPVL